jgi:membrane-bound serine protease (ClpP class)
MRKKVTNDAVAQARAIAEKRGRNMEWAEEAVREAVSVTANEALELNVIDYVASDVPELLELANGDTVEIASGEVVLELTDATIESFEMDWRDEFMFFLADPNIAYVLMMLGFYGLLFELDNPGAVIPGVIGVISLILAFFAFQTLPVNLAGILLILVGIAMFILEVKVTSFGFLTLGGIVGIAFGSIMLFDTEIPALQVSWTVIVPTLIATVLFFALAITLAIRAQKNKVATGTEGMIGEEGVTVGQLNPDGKVRIGGEYWKATAEDGTLEPDTPIVVVGEGRLRLTVRKRS